MIFCSVCDRLHCFVKLTVSLRASSMNFRCRVLKSKSGGASLLLTVPNVLMVPVRRPTSQHLRCTAAVLMLPLKIPYREGEIWGVILCWGAGRGECSCTEDLQHYLSCWDWGGDVLYYCVLGRDWGPGRGRCVVLLRVGKGVSVVLYTPEGRREDTDLKSIVLIYYQ